MDNTEPRLVMLIQEEPAQCRLITALAARDGWHAIVVRDAESAIAMLGTHQGMQLSAIILDHEARGDGCGEPDDPCHLIAEIRSRRPALPMLMLTTSASPLLAVEAMRAGATDYLIKPVASDQLLQALRSATSRTSAGWVQPAELQPLSEKLSANPDFESMIGASPAFRVALAIAAKAARGHGPVLIEGECGSGKEMLARAMHAASSRSKAPLRIFNVGATPANSLESALFGHEKGAFPGAFDRQIGAIQHCDGGTLVLDEVDRLPAAIQDRLFEALAGGHCRPVGARHSFRVDVRYILAANYPLRDMVEDGYFLGPLAQAMAAVSLTLPPLRERTGDIAALARYFLGRIGEQPGLRPLGITDGALALLAAYEWPGNVRQLQAVLFRASVFCDSDALTADNFPQLVEQVRRVPASIDGGNGGGIGVRRHDSTGITLFTSDGHLRPLDEIEGDVIRLAIGHYRGRMTEVARRLGIGRSTLYRKLSDLGFDSPAHGIPGTIGSHPVLACVPPLGTMIVADL
ncbi:MAG: sigma-54 dependent transcriptional regulator [Pseudomonadota bacterium]|nr:sigma-54 dependent transcriptional regulator [Pseudomonadota bacterium]